MKNQKTKLFHSILALLLCVSMLVGSTFAWFTDSVTSGINTIAAGNLDVELYHSNAAVTNEKVKESTMLFMDLQGDPILWEPGVVSYENLRVVNEGDLALVYRLAINTANENYILDPANGEMYGLSQILKVGFVEGGITATDRASVVASVDTANWTTMSDFLRNGSLLPEGKGESEQTWGIVIWWEPGDDDNRWNLNNGKTLNEGDVLKIDLGISLVATQEVFENDSFGNDYDTDAKTGLFPDFTGSTVTTPVTPNAENKTEADVTMSAGQVSAAVPAGTQLAAGTTALTLTVTELEATGSNIVLGENEAIRALDVHIEGIASDNTAPITVTLAEIAPVGLNMGNYKLYHVENGATNEMTLVAAADAFTAHNQFKYDPATGTIVLYMATFSEVTVVAEPAAWEGGIDHSWYVDKTSPYSIANGDQLYSFAQIVGGMADLDGKDGADKTPITFADKTINLVADIDLNDGEESNKSWLFYPVGYYNSEYHYTRPSGETITSGLRNFEGTFDGQGHTISNFYQNTWEMKGDHDWYNAATEQYYRDGMGLFGRVYGGTVKNLTVNNFKSDGEITTTGCIAAYADGATFENIAITNCNPRVYNIGNGGIVGCVGWYAKEAGLKTTFTNITVDNSNKISALWGSYDVACGGIVGQYYPTSSQTSFDSPKNAGIHLENCHVAAQMDVYNDVCANYQYYAYRYAGMLIGSVRENVTENGHSYPKMDGITSTGCTVHYGEWNHYYYCEFVKNGHPSYSGPNDYKFSRVPESELVFHEDGTVTCTHNHTDVEDNRAIYLPFSQLVTGYGWGVTSKGLEEFPGVVVLDTIYNGQTVEKFETKFTGDFLYRVGNVGTVSAGAMFKAKPDYEKLVNSTGVVIGVENVSGTAAGVFTADETGKDWTKGTVKFSGTGVVKVTIQDFEFCKPLTIYLEVVDAENIVAISETISGKSVVLLNDCGFSSVEINDGGILYGNGFTVSCGSDSASSSFGQFVKLNNGTLDNVQIVCPNYDYAALYTNSQLKDSDKNRTETTNGTTRYFNAKSAVGAEGNSQILNSRISGGRAAVFAASGNIVIDNSRLEGGAVATVIISGANSFTFKDTTLIQKPTASTYDSNKVLVGMSVLYLCDPAGNATPTTLEGYLVQNAWVDGSCTPYMPEGTSSIASTVLNKTNYTHTVNGKTSVNLGFAYMPNEGTTVNTPSNITDKRVNKDSVPYAYETVKATVPTDIIDVNIDTYVYSYKNTYGTDSSFTTEQEYVPNRYSDIVAITFADTTEGLTIGKSYGNNGWVYDLNIDLDKLPGYALDFSKLSMSINGTQVTEFNVNGNTKPAAPIPVATGGTSYALTATVDGKMYTATLIATGVETTKDAPSLINKIGGSKITADNVAWGASKCVVRKADDGATNYTVTAPVLQGLIVRYWSVSQAKYVDLDLTTLTPGNSTSLNGTNNFWEYKDPNGDFTLKLTNTAYVHDSNKKYAMPVAYNGTLYFVSTDANGLVSTGSGARTLQMEYVFCDNNAGELSFTHKWSQAYDKNNTLNYKDLTGIKDGCVTPDTLITLANGKQVRVDSLTGNEKLLVWNLKTGKYEAAPIVFVDSEEEAEYEIIHLYFSDGSDVKVIYEHGFFDLDLGKYVYIDATNYADYVGHRFVAEGNIAKNKWNIVTLDKVVIEREVTTAWSPVTFEHLCYYTNGVLSMPGGISGLFNIFEVDTKTMSYDAKLMQKDIATYGLLTLEDFGGLITQEAFDAFNGAYLNVAIGKGLLTWEDIAYMAERYIPLM